MNAAAEPKPVARPLPHPGRGIVVISERESLGDGFYKLHLLRALKRNYPDEKIAWLVSESDSPYRTAMARIAAPYIERVVGAAGLRRPWGEAVRRLRDLPPCGLAIDHRSNNAVIAATRLLLRADLYQASTPGYLFCSRRPKGWRRPQHKLARLFALLEAVSGVAADGSGEIDLPAAAMDSAASWLPAGPRYVGLVPGASSPSRYWPLERQIELAGWVEAQGWQPVMLLGPLERQMLGGLRQALPRALFPGCSETETLSSVDLSLALGRRLAAAVSSDTGTGHLLAAAGTPLLSLFGPTDPRVWRPIARRGRVIWSRDYGGRDIARIPLEAVTAALAVLMDSETDAPP